MLNIRNRYSLCSVNNNFYSSISSGSTQLSTQNPDGSWTQGIVYLPYILNLTSIDEKEYFRKILRDERIKKLEKINKNL